MMESMPAGDSDGLRCSISAATPAMCGQAIEVPFQVSPL